MRKIVFPVLAAVFAIVTACSSETYHTDASALPEGPRSEVETNFDAKVVGVKIETNTIGDDEYEVTLEDGTRIDYEGNQWTDIEAGNGKAVPDRFVPAAILSYVTSNYPGMMITKIDRDRDGYEVDLSNGLEIKFDTDGGFVKFD